MATLINRNGIYYAKYTDKNGKVHRRSTEIRIPEGSRNQKIAADKAMEVANLWEKTAQGGGLRNENVRHLLNATMKIASENSPSAKEWLEQYQPRGSEQNKLNSRRAISLFVAFLEANEKPGITLAEIKKSICAKFLGEQLRDKGLASGTVSSYKNHLARAFRVAIEEEVLFNANPFSLLSMKDLKLEYAPERKGSDKTERRPFTMDEMKIILNKFPAPYNDLAAVSFYTCGQRIGDCISLQWSQIDFVKGTISFITEKTGRHLELPLLPELGRRLEKRHLLSQALESPYVFPELNREAKASKGAVSSRFTAYLDAFGIHRNVEHRYAHGKRRKVSDTSFHSIRHTAVSFLRTGGVAADVSRAVVGHESESVEREYFSLNLTQKRDAMSVLVQAMEGSSTTQEK